MVKSGNKANKTAMPKPVKTPEIMADTEGSAETFSIGKKSFKTMGKKRCINVPSNAPMTAPPKPIADI